VLKIYTCHLAFVKIISKSAKADKRVYCWTTSTVSRRAVAFLLESVFDIVKEKTKNLEIFVKNIKVFCKDA